MKIKFDETVVAGVDVNNTQIYFNEVILWQKDKEKQVKL